MAGNLLMNISQDERERAIFRSRRKWQTDQDSNIATAEDRGSHKGKLEMAMNLIRMGLGNSSQIAKAAEMTEEGIEQLREEISNKPNFQA